MSVIFKKGRFTNYTNYNIIQIIQIQKEYLFFMRMMFKKGRFTKFLLLDLYSPYKHATENGRKQNIHVQYVYLLKKLTPINNQTYLGASYTTKCNT